jgi:hypothetical protein
MRIVELMLETMELLGQLHEEATSAEQKERLSAGLDALGFISALGQAYGFEDYRQNRATSGPPLVIAAFNTRKEADVWMRDHPEPPHHANILIAGEYFLTAYDRATDHRAILHSSTLAYYLTDMISKGLPAPAAIFKTREEADAWITGQPEPVRQVFITISGEYYLAVYHYKVNLQALYPISIATKPMHAGKQAD